MLVVTTLGQMLEKAYDISWSHQTQSKTRATHIRALHLYLGADTPLEQLRDISWLVQKRDEIKENTSLAPNTINKYFGAISNAASLCLRHRLISTPITVPPQLKQRQSRVYCLTSEELKFIDNMTDTPLKQVFLFLTNTGMRAGELLKAKVSDVNHVDKTIYLPDTKTHTSRSIPLNDQALASMDRLIKASRANDDYEYVTHLTYRQVQYGWDKKVRGPLNQEGNEDFTVHTLRHTFATRLLRKGADVTLVKELLGHKDIKTTMRYIHLDTEDLRGAVNLL